MRNLGPSSEWKLKPEAITDKERGCAGEAVKAIEACGGMASFDQYDEAICARPLFAPLNWIDGWGDPTLHRRNNEKLAIFAAVALGWVTALPDGYSLPAD